MEQKMENPIPLEELSYEKAFQELEQIVSRLESETQNLEESLTLYERGQALAHYCADLLEKAELRMEQLKPVSDNLTGQED
jgi:exodeoxyribonuclease VII small subunit